MTTNKAYVLYITDTIDDRKNIVKPNNTIKFLFSKENLRNNNFIVRIEYIISKTLYHIYYNVLAE